MHNRYLWHKRRRVGNILDDLYRREFKLFFVARTCRHVCCTWLYIISLSFTRALSDINNILLRLSQCIHPSHFRVMYVIMIVTSSFIRKLKIIFFHFASNCADLAFGLWSTWPTIGWQAHGSSCGLVLSLHWARSHIFAWLSQPLLPANKHSSTLQGELVWLLIRAFHIDCFHLL